MLPNGIDCVDRRATSNERAVHLLHVFKSLRRVQRQLHKSRSASREKKEHQRLLIAFFQKRENRLRRFPALRIWHWMSCHEVFHSGQVFLRRRWRGHHALKSYKRRQHLRQTIYHCMRRFPHRHHAQFFEITQIDFGLAAYQHGSSALQFALHRPGNIDGRQGLVENLTGELLQLPHERCAWSFVT